MYKISIKNWVVILTIVSTALISFGLSGYFSYNRSIELDECLNLRAKSIIEPLADKGNVFPPSKLREKHSLLKF